MHPKQVPYQTIQFRFRPNMSSEIRYTTPFGRILKTGISDGDMVPVGGQIGAEKN